jgi:hypothetical protein
VVAGGNGAAVDHHIPAARAAGRLTIPRRYAAIGSTKSAYWNRLCDGPITTDLRAAKAKALPTWTEPDGRAFLWESTGWRKDGNLS